MHEIASADATSGKHVEDHTSGRYSCPIYGDYTMILRFFDMQDQTNPFNGLVICNNETLAAVLESFRNRKPFFAELLGENGDNLLIGIGGTLGCVQHSRDDGNPPYLMAVATPMNRNAGDIEFLAGDTDTPIRARHILPFEQVKQIAIHFRETGAPSRGVSWEEV